MEQCEMGQEMMQAGRAFCQTMMGTQVPPAKDEAGIDEKTTELIAIGAAIGAHCQPCLTHHLEKARELGVAEDKIRTAIETGHMVERGAMSAMKKFSAELMQPKQECVAAPCSDSDPQPQSCCA